jgi:hypothetical protein
MALVLLLVTGAMEEKALARSLKGCFPAHDFVCKPQLDGFTSSRLPPDFAALSETARKLLNVDKFLKSMIGAFAPGGRRDAPRPDFLLAIEDLELFNTDSPANITNTVRDGMTRNLQAWPADGPVLKRLTDALKERCSFHLMAPMTEAYFFAEPAAFARATAPGPDHLSKFDPDRTDPELFAIEDADYLTPSDLPKKDHLWRRANRRSHPKHYLEYLTDARLDNNPRYDETTLGRDALADLKWASMLTAYPAALKFARSLFADLTEMLGEAPTGCSLADIDAGECHPLTWPPPRDPVLRNL